MESKLDQLDWKVDVVLSHITPLKYEPAEVSLPGIDQWKGNKSIEQWLDRLEERLHYDKWHAGHCHTEKKVDRLQILFEDYDVLPNAQCITDV